METRELHSELLEQTRQVINQVKTYLTEDLVHLNFKISENAWSVLEIIEHLNRYARFYNPECKKRIATSKTASTATFKPGLLGAYFAKSMLPKEKLNTMKTFTNMNPNGSSLSKETLDEFLALQHQWLEVLELSQHVNWNKVKTSITISNIIKLKLGDTFRVVTYHNMRHMVQAQKAMEHAHKAIMV